MNKRILISALALVLVCCLCAGALTLVTGGIFLFGGNTLTSLIPTITVYIRPTPTPPPTQISMTRPPSTPQADETVVPTPMPTWGGDTIPADITAQMDEIQMQVEELRGLTALQPVKRTLLTQAQLRDKIKSQFLAENDTQSIKDDITVLSAFGLIDPQFDLYSFYLDLYSEQISGYYDADTKEMFVIQGEAFDGPERSTYAHEFTHTLQDQEYDLSDGLGLNDDTCQADSEYCAAVAALIEGDALLTEQYWLYTYGTAKDQRQIEEFYANLESPIYDSAPEFLKEDMGFPYNAGAEFVMALFQQGGFDQINTVYANPPVSTEQILHPEKYLVDQPVEVFLPDLSSSLGLNLRELDRGVIGEWYTYLLLGNGRSQAIRLSESQARMAAAGWGGDAYAVYVDEDSGNTILTAQWVWDTQADENSFFDSFKAYGNFRWGKPQLTLRANTLIWNDTPDGSIILQGDGLSTVWVMAPDNETAGQLLQALSQGAHAGAY